MGKIFSEEYFEHLVSGVMWETLATYIVLNFFPLTPTVDLVFFCAISIR